MPSLFGISGEESSDIESSRGVSLGASLDAESSPNTGGGGHARHNASGGDLAVENDQNVSQLHGALTRMSPRHAAAHLPTLDGQQRLLVLFLAMIEAQCKVKARETLNKNRSLGYQLGDDDEEVQTLAAQLYSQFSAQVGGSDIIPGNLAGPEGTEIRALYTSQFDTLLEKAAEQAVQTGLETSQTQPDLIETSTAAMDISALPKDKGHALLLASSPDKDDLAVSTPKALIGPNSNDASAKSVYETEYEELGVLGRGGFGTVYKARNHLDSQIYAIKKIVITSQKLQQSRESDTIEALLAELRTLARLQHTNIVRYYHGWLETSYNRFYTASRGPRLLEGLSSSQRLTSSDTTDDLQLQDLNLGSDDLRNAADDSLRLPDPRYDEADDDVVFAVSSNQDVFASQQLQRRPSKATTISSGTYKASMKSVGMDESEDPDIETIPRHNPSSKEESSSNKQKAHVSPIKKQQRVYYGPDITLCIKMSLHPLTLNKFLSRDPVKENDNYPSLRHCFHKHPSAAILSSILDGVQYLHSQKIIHRDLKPANIFMSVNGNTRPSLSGCVDIGACPECMLSKNDKGDRQTVWITPCIGDFGLIAEIKETISSPSSTPATYQPSALAALQPKPVGTQFYRPSIMPTKPPIICEKLDVYALGVIALELLYPFGTKAERAHVLTELGKGKLPSGFDKNEMATGILRMVCLDREERWGVEEVRKWLGLLQVNV